MPENNQKKRKPRSFVHESRYVLVVDGQRKASFEAADSAQREADKVRAVNPRLKVEIQDQNILRGISDSPAAPEPAPEA